MSGDSAGFALFLWIVGAPAVFLIGASVWQHGKESRWW